MVESERPLLHFTPVSGWLNDPNGLYYNKDTQEYHVYYQYSPEDRWNLPITWGHAITKDFVTWEHKKDKLLAPNKGEGAFSGCIVVDKENTSGRFAEKSEDNVVSVFTLHTPEKQVQNVTFLKGELPDSTKDSISVLDENSKQFRDPKVFWHEPTQKWIMVIAKCQEYEISIYASANLVDWEYKSGLKDHGLLGYQYECPNLVEIPVMDTNDATKKIGSKWVLFISINPGGPLGGSFVQYFVGEFDGAHFTPDTNETRIMDYGKDYYAMQVFANTDKDFVLGLGWASNWQYSEMTPSLPWKNGMAIPRKLYLKGYRANDDSPEHMNLFSEPYFHKEPKQDLLHVANIASGATFATDPVFRFKFDWSFNPKHVTRGKFSSWKMEFKAPPGASGNNGDNSKLVIGFEANCQAFFIDRGYINGQPENLLFNNRSTVDIVPQSVGTDGTFHYKVDGIVDRNTLELFFNDGYAACTNTFFLESSNFNKIFYEADPIFTGSHFQRESFE